MAIRLLATALAGLMSRQQQKVIDFLREENRVLREQIGKRRLRLTDDQRRRLATKGKLIGRKLLEDVCSIVTPETILRWHRRLTPAPAESWVVQLSRHLTDLVGGFLRSHRFLIHDRDPLFGSGFARALRAAGITPIRLPPRSPNLNAFAERFVRSIKEECLARIVPLGERHLRLTIEEYAEHYHLERNHQGIGNRLIESHLPSGEGRVRCRERLGGMLRFYHREAA